MRAEPQPPLQQDWKPLTRPGCVNVEARLLLVREGLALAMLRLAPRATLDEHASGNEIDVVCLEGAGYISVEDRVHTFSTGQRLTWPAGPVHRLWTADQGMITLMVEHL